MSELYLIIFAILAISALDVAAVGARAGFQGVSHARLLAQRDGGRIAALLATPWRVRAALNVFLVLARFLLAGLILLLMNSRPTAWPVAAGAAGLLVGAVLIFWLEWIVERAAARQPEIWAARMTAFTRVMILLTSFLTFPVVAVGPGKDDPEPGGAVTQDDLKTLVDAGEEDGVIEKEERAMIYSIFELGDTLAREIMVPRIDILAFDIDTPMGEVVDAILKAGYSRVPIYEETIDNTLGLLYAKDLLRAWREANTSATLRGLLRPAYFTPEGKKVDELLAEMQSQRIHMAIIVDEYGGVAGLVTMEDIVEEIFGEILDEYDQGEEAPYQMLADGSYIFLGRISLDDFNEVMHSSLNSEETESLGGYIYSRLGRVPAVGEMVLEGGLLLTVEQVSARRIRKVSARWELVENLEDEGKDRADG